MCTFIREAIRGLILTDKQFYAGLNWPKMSQGFPIEYDN